MLDRLCERGGVCHVWGHSWEVLDGFLRYAAQRVPPEGRVTVAEIARVWEAAPLQPAVAV